MGKTIVLFASARRDGNTGQLTDCIARELEIDVLDLSQYDISPYDYAHQNRKDDFEVLMTRVLDADNIIFATPVYWYAMCSTMKCFLDRLTDYLDIPPLKPLGRRLKGKHAFIVCTSASDSAAECFLTAFTQTFTYLGMQYGGYVHGACATGFDRELIEPDLGAFVTHFQ